MGKTLSSAETPNFKFAIENSTVGAQEAKRNSSRL